MIKTFFYTNINYYSNYNNEINLIFDIKQKKFQYGKRDFFTGLKKDTFNFNITLKKT